MEELKIFIKKRSVIASAVLSVIAFVLFWASYSACWAYMSNTADCMPYLAMLFMIAPLILWLVNLFVRNGIFNTVTIIYTSLAIIGYLILFLQILGALFFFTVEILPIVLVVFLACIVLFVFFSHKVGKKGRIAVGSTLLTIFALYAIFGLFNLKPCYINANPVIFAVEDEYQICWSTSSTATGAVEIGGNVYYDNPSGVSDSSTIHKVRVPREALDNAKSYTVISQGIIHRRTYVSTIGGKATKSYTFCPVNGSDGLRFYNFSDNHMQRKGVTKAASYWGDSLDFVVANGDQFNNISHEYQVTLVYRTLSQISGSRIPVIMTRGNHETAGSIVERADEFLPSYEGKFYYTVRFDDTLFVVLDYATDHDDNDTVIRPAHFEQYRNEELEWLDKLSEKDLQTDGIRHIVTLCHVSFLRLGDRTKSPVCFEFARLTEKLGTELMLNGHSHRLEYLAPGEGYNNTPFVAVIGSLRSDRYKDRDSISEYQFTGTAVEITSCGYKLAFTNSKHQVVESYEF